MSAQDSAERLRQATDDIRQEYMRRREGRTQGGTGAAMFASRLRSYDQALRTIGQSTLSGARVLDLGCASGKWLQICCDRWQANPGLCFGVDLREHLISAWKAENPDSAITLICKPANEIDFADCSFDIVHQSMMLSSVVDPELRTAIALQIWRVVKPGGYFVSYDFWINPMNPKTVGIRVGQLLRMFPEGEVVFKDKITLVPHLTRQLTRVSERLPVLLEKLVILNTHNLVVIRKNVASRDTRLFN